MVSECDGGFTVATAERSRILTTCRTMGIQYLTRTIGTGVGILPASPRVL
jgi:hypothetical protein